MGFKSSDFQNILGGEMTKKMFMTFLPNALAGRGRSSSRLKTWAYFLRANFYNSEDTWKSELCRYVYIVLDTAF